MIKTVRKNTKGLSGEIVIPADKSVSHRAVMLLSLAKGTAYVRNFSSGADCKSTLELYQKLGVEINYVDEKILKITSNGKLFNSNTTEPLYCGNSGTTMRLTCGVLAGQKFNSILIGDESLTRRPMKRIIEPLSLMGAKINSNEFHAPLSIRGSNLYGIDYHSAISSAQVKSSIILAGLSAQGKTTYTEPFQSRNHTELMLKYLGAEINTHENSTEIIHSKLEAKDIEVVGDISSASFFIVGGLVVPNSNFIIRNVGINPTRTGIIDVVQRMSGQIELMNKREIGGETVADIRVIYSENLKSCTISGNDIPRLIDELPIIAVLATQAEGKTIIKDAQDLRNKEADRIKCLVSELKKIGAEIEEIPDGFVIYGKTQLKGNVSVESFHDHRLAMSFYVAGLISEKEIAINNFEWTNISFPEFEQLFYKINA